MPSDTTEIDFSLVKFNGNSVSGTPFDFSILTPPNGSDCSAVSGGFSCSFTASAPAGTDSYTIVACAGSTTGCTGGSAVLLSETYAANISVTAGATTTLQTFTLNPVVGSMSWTGGTSWTNGSAAPTFTTGYSCATACWDPLLNNHGTPLNDTLSLALQDAKGETIIPASGGGNGSGSPNVPLYLTQGGAVDFISVTCNDGHTEYMNSTGGSSPVSSPVTSQFANGFTNGTYNATNSRITSPVTGSDGSTGTVLNGTTSTVFGNNGVYINYDGAGSGYIATSSGTCTATDSNSSPLTATYYFGFAAGS